jgi:hypothetical protein
VIGEFNAERRRMFLVFDHFRHSISKFQPIMSIPPFNEHGWLPEGVHGCTVDEARMRFGSFQGSDWRPRLWRNFVEFLNEAKGSGFVKFVVLDGSFVTAKPDPNDIDLILVVDAKHDFSANLRPNQYNLLAQKCVRKRFGFDIVIVKDGSNNMQQAIEFFQQVRQRAGGKKGILRITI